MGAAVGGVAGLTCGVAWALGSETFQDSLVESGWLHYGGNGCRERTRVNLIDIADLPAPDIWFVDTIGSGPARAFAAAGPGKSALLAALRRQRARGVIGRDQPEAIVDFRIRVGCPVPCAKMHYATDGEPDDMGEHNRLYRTLYGVPAPLSSLENAAFSNLPLAAAAEWPERFVDAIRPGADLASVSDRWLLWLLAGSDSPLVSAASGSRT